MLCSSCLKTKGQTIQLPCSHIICPECIPRQSFVNNMFRYQCQTCSVYHEIPLNGDNIVTNKQRNEEFREYEMRSSSQSSGNETIILGEYVYCWSCEQALAIKEYIRGKYCVKLGKHHKHEVSTFEEALPRIKNTLMQQVRISKQIKSHFQQVKYGMQNNGLQISYNNLVDKVNEFFNTQFQLLVAKRSQIIDQLGQHCNRLNNQTKQIIDKITPVIYDLQELQTKMQSFFNNKLPITEINPVRRILEKIDTFKQLTKDKNALAIEQMPQFVINFNLQKYVQQCCKIQPIQRTSKNKQRYASFQKSADKNNHPIQKLPRQKFTKYPQDQIQQKQIKLQRKVKLVQKLKDKMKYNNSMCSTGLL